MTPLRYRHVAFVVVLALAMEGPTPVVHAMAIPGSVPRAAAASPDARMYTSYEIFNDYTILDFLVCGTAPEVYGCEGSGQFPHFGRAGAMIEGAANVDPASNSVWRDVYVVDQAAGGGSSKKVTLWVYRITDVFTVPIPTITLKTLKRIDLPLVGGATAKTFMAGNASRLYIGTDQGSVAVTVDKSSYALTMIDSFRPASLAAITADDAGYVTTSFGGPRATYVVNTPDGRTDRRAAGSRFMLGTLQGLTLTDLDVASATGTAAQPGDFEKDIGATSQPMTGTAALTGLYATYSLDFTRTEVDYSLCGPLPGADRCYANGMLGTFRKAGAMLQSEPIVDSKSQTVTRQVFVVDQAVGGGTSTSMALDVFNITEFINGSATVTPLATIALPTSGGVSARVFIGADPNYVFVGSDQSPLTSTISKRSWRVSSDDPFSPPVPQSLISVDQYGFTTLTYGDPCCGSISLDPSGKYLQDGGEPLFMVGIAQGQTFTGSNLSVTADDSPKALEIHFRESEH